MIFWPGGTIRSDLYKSLRMADFRLHLFSFYHEHNRRFDEMKDPMLDFRYFADSGAFSAWTRGDPIDIEEYSAFVRYHAGYLEAYAALDVIPESTHPSELERAAGRSWQNYLDMKADGLDPIPIYHYGESRKWLDMLLGSGCTYIGLGGMGNANRAERAAWLDSVFHDLPDGIKVHGFGVSAINLLFRYPWYSADSMTWRLAANNGNVFIPLHDGTQFLYDRPPYLVHTKELLTTASDEIDEWLRIVDTDRQKLFDDYRHRGACNAVFMREVTAHHAEHGPKKRSSAQQGFFK